MNIQEFLFRRWPIVLIALLALMVLSSPLRADDDDDDDDLQAAVNCDAGDDLQIAIDTAANGDVISIGGRCLGPFVITDANAADNLTLEGTPYATLDGNGAGPVVTVDSRSVVLAYLTIEGGVASDFIAVAGAALFDSEVMLVAASRRSSPSRTHAGLRRRNSQSQMSSGCSRSAHMRASKSM